jgi:hypothetical protein
MGLLDEEFLTVAEVAELLKLNQQTVRNWIDQGVPPGVPCWTEGADQPLGSRAVAGEEPDSAAAGRLVSAAQALWDGELPPAPVPPTEAE